MAKKVPTSDFPRPDLIYRGRKTVATYGTVHDKVGATFLSGVSVT
jgi:hypothetical protein